MSKESVWLLIFTLWFAAIAPAQAQQAEEDSAHRLPRRRFGHRRRAALQAFRQGLRDLGYVEGQNIIIDYRHVDRDFERLPELAAELVA